MGRKLFIGDVHGCIEELTELLTLLNLKSNDQLYFVGDLINKGPDSRSVLQLAKDHHSIIVKGNHELGLLHSYEHQTEGFSQVKENLGGELDDWCEWIRSWPLYIEEEQFIMVHAGLSPQVHPKDEKISILTRIRTWDGIGEDLNDPNNPPWFDFYQGDKKIIFGHWAQRGLVRRKNVIGLDTGCVWGGSLTAYDLELDKIYQVHAKKQYKTPK